MVEVFCNKHDPRLRSLILDIYRWKPKLVPISLSFRTATLHFAYWRRVESWRAELLHFDVLNKNVNCQHSLLQTHHCYRLLISYSNKEQLIAVYAYLVKCSGDTACSVLWIAQKRSQTTWQGDEGISCLTKCEMYCLMTDGIVTQCLEANAIWFLSDKRFSTQ